MNRLEFWRYKVLQTLHDPIQKTIPAGLLNQKEAAREQLAMVTGEKQSLPFLSPDFLASGADRPVVGDAKTCDVNWRSNPIITHPLQPETSMRVEWEAIPVGKGSKKKAEELGEAILAALRTLALSKGEWSEASRVRLLLLRLWRQFPEILRNLGFPYPFIPADSRIPDHSVWDHTRVASAAAFLVAHQNKSRPPEREPWMIAVTLGGVQRFISETRTTRDLWTASMIYADLAWAAMRPVVETLGPDAVLYPDLRGNPAADRWLLGESPEAATEPVRKTGATSFAAMLPNTFIALAPRGGGDSGLPDLKQIAEECTQAVHERWRALADAAEQWLVKRHRPGNGPWQKIWRRQVDGRFGEPPVTWAAIPWPRRMKDIGPAVRRSAVPGQSPGAEIPEFPEPLATRERDLSPWLPHRVWRHYEMARDVFWHTDTQTGKNYLANERGFDYPLVHRQLRTVLAMCKAQGAARVAEEPGEKCSISGREEALSNGPQGTGPLVARRRTGAREFWSGLDVDGTGVERLGSTATIKRFLVSAGEPVFTATWESIQDRGTRGNETPRVPFPSTAAIAASKFIEALAEKAEEPGVSEAVWDYVRAFQKTNLQNKVDQRVLPGFVRASKAPAMKEFLSIEPEYLFPETLEVLIRREEQHGRRHEGLREFQKSSRNLRRKAAEAKLSAPGKFVAVLRMDGDRIGRLILGDPEVIKTRWRDVLHRSAIEQIRKNLPGTGWPGLLGEPRHSGPFLHSSITHSLADFAHKMVAWVVEREFGGRLIYVGGDDLLAILPAAEAVPAAARLQQLFSAPYVLDTDSDADPWLWRRSRANDVSGQEEARQRFRVPSPSDEGEIRLSERKFERHAAGDTTSTILPDDRPVALYTMLGRRNSLSAGIAVGHYKEPLSALLRTAGEMLEDVAKNTMDRSSVAVALLSNGGRKATFVAHWREEPESAKPPASERKHLPPDIQEHLLRVQRAFRPGRDPSAAGARPLPRRLPYAVREQIRRMGRVLLDPCGRIGAEGDFPDADSRKMMVRRLLGKESGLKDGENESLEESMTRLIECGINYASRLEKRQRAAGGQAEPPSASGQDPGLAGQKDDTAGRLDSSELADLIVGGFLLARKLSSEGDGDGIS